MSDTGSEVRQIGRYRLEGMLGQGAMGTVHRARDTLIERTVALKTVRRDAGDATREHEIIERFRMEAQAAGRLMHPNIVAVYDYGETDEVAYIAMEFVDGTALSALLGERATPLPRALDWFGDLMTGLDYAHAHGVVHRDIKPANLLVTRDGRVKISDFGIARLESSTLTQIGTMLGTPSYMSPEQFRGDPVDGRSDLFSAGVVLYQMLTGQRPFTGATAAVMQQVLNHTPAPPSSLNPALPAAFDAVVMQALAKAPEERHASARAFRQALDAALRDASDADATVFAAVAGAAPDDATILAPPAAAVSATWAEGAAQRSRGGTSAGTGMGTSASMPAWLLEAAPDLEDVLTRQIGPMARLLLRRVAQTAPDFDALTGALLEHIPSPQARAMFEQQVTAIRTRHLPPTASVTSTRRPRGGTASRTRPRTVAPTAAPAPVVFITAEDAARFVPVLALAIGPIAAIVVKRALREPCSRDAFAARLAEHIEDEAARARFLAQAAMLA